ncbi:MAG: hypothetical protein CM1200mP25_2430 [Acidobacteriota bacterium]|nr:MAG: hypothetical protein CM1200mP25_2430 [Acidobacteriota bacterium]
MWLDTEFVRVIVTVGLSRYVDDQRRLGPDAFPAVVDEVRNLHECGVFCAEEELVHLSFGWGAVPSINHLPI